MRAALLVLGLPAVLVCLVSLAGARSARAQSLVEQRPEDPCEAAHALDVADTTPAAEHIRRSCRLLRFEDWLAVERQQQVAVEQLSREERIQRWVDATQPWRVTNPISIEGFAGAGLASYGFSLSWDFLRRGEVGGWIGWRPISCTNNYNETTSACGRTAFGLRGRWYLTSYNFTPYLGGGLSLMTSELAVVPTTGDNAGKYLNGSGRANSISGEAGLALGYHAFRMSVEYIFEYTFYTGASLDDTKQTPSPDLDAALTGSLRADRNGFRVQAGYAF